MSYTSFAGENDMAPKDPMKVSDLFEDIPKPVHFTAFSWLRYEATIWLFEFIAHFIVVMVALLVLWVYFIQNSEKDAVNTQVNAQIGTQFRGILDNLSLSSQTLLQTTTCTANAPVSVSILQQAFQGESQVTATANLCVQQSMYAIKATLLSLFFLCLYVGIRKIGLFALRNLFILLTVGAAVACFELHMVNYVVPNYVPCMETDMQAAMIEGLLYTPATAQ
jgi:hypothetical protein